VKGWSNNDIATTWRLDIFKRTISSVTPRERYVWGPRRNLTVPNDYRMKHFRANLPRHVSLTYYQSTLSWSIVSAVACVLNRPKPIVIDEDRSHGGGSFKQDRAKEKKWKGRRDRERERGGGWDRWKKKKKDVREKDIRYGGGFGACRPTGRSTVRLFSPPYIKPGDPLHAIDSEPARFARFRLCWGRRSCWTRWNIARNLNKFTASARRFSPPPRSHVRPELAARARTRKIVKAPAHWVSSKRRGVLCNKYYITGHVQMLPKPEHNLCFLIIK